MKGNIAMSNTEIFQVEILEKLKRREIKQKKAADILSLSVRQVKRKLRAYKLDGAISLVHRARGKTSNNKISQKILDQAVQIVKDKYWDFGPTLAHEKLVEEDSFSLSLSRLRQEMISVSLWQPKVRRNLAVHRLRERRACFGELIQLDGSPHDWFEGRAPRCNLNVAIDDATGKSFLELSPTETTQSYFRLIEHYLLEFGMPRAIYADKHSIFQVNHSGSLDHKKPSKSDPTEGLTQFGRAMKELNIELIPANSPQAKGRVEKINGTFQNRLVKELRLRHIASIEEANLFLPTFTRQYSAKFAVKARSNIDMHRKLPKGLDLPKILCIKEKRVLSKNLTCQYGNIIFQIQTKRSSYALRKMVVTIRERYDGTVTIWDDRDKLLEYTTIKKTMRQKEVSSKEINRLMDDILIEQARGTYQKKNPWESNPVDFEGQSLYYKPVGAV